jgi:hypothetical protein
LQEFPVFFPVSRETNPGERFAVDYYLHIINALESPPRISPHSRQIREYSAVKGTGERPPVKEIAAYLKEFSTREFRSPFSNCDET